MIIGTLAVSRQMDYIRDKNLGLDKENIGYFWMAGAVMEKSETAKQELLKNPNITGVTRTNQLPTYVGNSTSDWKWEGKDPSGEVLLHMLNVDEDYVKTFKMEMAEGRFFSREFPTDSLAVVVNETAVEVMGMPAPIGKRISSGSQNFTIIGVVKDFHFKPVRTKIEPLVMLMQPNQYYAMMMRIRPENIAATIAFVEKRTKIQCGDAVPFNFLDQDYDNLYRRATRRKLSGYLPSSPFDCQPRLYGLAPTWRSSAPRNRH
jgi:hypothetical protein